MEGLNNKLNTNNSHLLSTFKLVATDGVFYNHGNNYRLLFCALYLKTHYSNQGKLLVIYFILFFPSKQKIDFFYSKRLTVVHCTAQGVVVRSFSLFPCCKNVTIVLILLFSYDSVLHYSSFRTMNHIY